jgi:hypothetical protein
MCNEFIIYRLNADVETPLICRFERPAKLQLKIIGYPEMDFGGTKRVPLSQRKADL